MLLQQLPLIFQRGGRQLKGIGEVLPIVVEGGQYRPVFVRLAKYLKPYFLGKGVKATMCDPLK
jgi:hypothetical protein